MKKKTANREREREKVHFFVVLQEWNEKCFFFIFAGVSLCCFFLVQV